jgi:hypothetical protein
MVSKFASTAVFSGPQLGTEEVLIGWKLLTSESITGFHKYLRKIGRASCRERV